MQKHYVQLREIISIGKLLWQNPRFVPRPDQQVLVAGPAGCGKSSVVHRVAADCGAVLLAPVVDNSPDALRQLFAEATDLTSEGVCIVLLKNVETACAKTLSILLERAAEVSGLCVVATTTRPSRLDSALRRPGRLGHEIHISVPNESEREAILSALLKPLVSPESLEAVVRATAAFTPGYVASDLALLCQNAAFRARGNRDGRHWEEELRWAARHVRPSAVGSVPNVTPTPVAGLEDVKAALRTAVLLPLQRPDALKRLGLPPPKGMLLYGPPGCAKTSVVREIAADGRITFLSCSAAEVYSPYVGEAEKNVVELFRRARFAAPSLLFLDEIEALVGSRSEQDSGVQERVLASFLMEMDGLGSTLDSGFVSQANVVVVAATNRPDLLDAALLRPGRLDKLIAVPPPDRAGRLAVLQIHTKKTPLDADVDLSAIASATHLYSGADLAVLCKEAALRALTEEGMDVQQVSARHFEHALSVMKPSLTQAQVDWYCHYKWTSGQAEGIAPP